jgi:hypothetical protein
MSESFVSTFFNFGVWKTYVESSDILIFDETSESTDSLVLPVINCKLFLTSTNNTNYGIYFEKSQIRNVPKPTDIEKYYQEKSQLEMPDLKNVPKI